MIKIKQAGGLMFSALLRRSLFALLLLVAPFSIVVADAQVSYAQSASSETACEALGAISGRDCGSDQDEASSSTLAKAVGLISWAAGLIGIVMVMVAGLRYVTSQGDPQKVGPAKNALIYAAIGLVVVALSQAIVRFVLNQSVSV